MASTCTFVLNKNQCTVNFHQEKIFTTCSHRKFYHTNILSCVWVHRGYGDLYRIHLAKIFFHKRFLQYKGTLGLACIMVLAMTITQPRTSTYLIIYNLINIFTTHWQDIQLGDRYIITARLADQEEMEYMYLWNASEVEFMVDSWTGELTVTHFILFPRLDSL